MAATDRPNTAQRFNESIVREAVDFANKIILLSDPEVQQEHERGMEQIRQGQAVPLDKLRDRLDLP